MSQVMHFEVESAIHELLEMVYNWVNPLGK